MTEYENEQESTYQDKFELHEKEMSCLPLRVNNFKPDDTNRFTVTVSGRGINNTEV